MKNNTSIIKYFIIVLIFILIISIIIIAELKYNSFGNYVHDLYPKSSINIKYQLPWQRVFYFNRIKEFEQKPIGNNKIVFLGNSITEGGGNWSNRFKTNNIVNRGISGDYTEGVLNRLNEIIYYKPISVFLLIGINDFFKDNSTNLKINPTYVAENIFNIANIIKNGSSSTLVFIQTIFPINNQHYMKVKKVDYNFLQSKYRPSINEQIKKVNSILINNKKHNVIDLHSLFLNNEGVLDSKFSLDGVHLNQKGYQVLTDTIKPLIILLNNQ